MLAGRWSNATLSSSGYVAVWAKENTREALFDALLRKEVYASTGPRIALRFFGGWNYEREDLIQSDFVQRGYLGGVPMGGELTDRPEDVAPVFILKAARDPLGANLDRMQVIKGWIDPEGNRREKIFDVALSSKSRLLKGGDVLAVGNTVDPSTATYKNNIGAPELSAFWEDPEFNPKESAFYYVRVLEIPTPRWTTYDAAFFQLEAPRGSPLTVQQRAYSSPIWYMPSK